MATIKPFKAYRPAENADKIACPPYDVISSEEARKMAEGNPISFLHIDKPEIDLPVGTDLYDSSVYAKGRENLDKFISDGILKEEKKPCFYIYAQTMDGRTQYGIVAATSTEEYDKGIIRKHELTRKDKEEDRTRHIQTLEATTGPVFLTYPDNQKINELVADICKKEPIYNFTTEDKITHKVWLVADDAIINMLEEEFKNIPLLYVADGHHRSASASNNARQKRAENPGYKGGESYNYFLSVIFPASHLYVMAYNRLVKDLNGFSEVEFFDALKQNFEIEKTKLQVPTTRHQFCMYIGKKWYLLTAKPSAFDAADAVGSLDVSILQNKVLAPLLAIQDPRTDKRISFVGGIRGTKELIKEVDSGEFKVAFSMYPTSIEELMKVADQNLIMPPKSTWFEPKLRSGLLIYKY